MSAEHLHAEAVEEQVRHCGQSRAKALRHALRLWLQQHGLKVPDAIILTTARSADRR